MAMGEGTDILFLCHDTMCAETDVRLNPKT